MQKDKITSTNSLTNEEIVVFIRENSPMFYLFASKYITNHDEIEDVLQECCMKLWINKDTITISTSATNYVFTMIRNIAYDRKKSKHMDTVEFDEVKESLFSDEDMLRNIIEIESSKIIADALKQLSPMSRKVMNYVLEGKKNKEIAEELGISINSLKTIKYRALARLSTLLPKNLLIALISISISNQ